MDVVVLLGPEEKDSFMEDLRILYVCLVVYRNLNEIKRRHDKQ